MWGKFISWLKAGKLAAKIAGLFVATVAVACVVVVGVIQISNGLSVKENSSDKLVVVLDDSPIVMEKESDSVSEETEVVETEVTEPEIIEDTEIDNQEDEPIADTPEDASDEKQESSEKQEEKSEEIPGEDDTEETTEEDTTSTPVVTGRYVKFDSKGGSEIAGRWVVQGTKICTLPTPSKEDSIFLGWYYDEELTKAVASTDAVIDHMTLYASYLQEAPIDTLNRKTFASSEDVDSDFAIYVVASEDSFDVPAVLAAIEAKNLSNPNQKNFVNVTKSGNLFTITGSNPYDSGKMTAEEGFAQGSAFRLTLKDERLNFLGEEASVRDYNFTTAAEEIHNLSTQDGIVYIAINELKNITNNGEAVATLNMPLYRATVGGDAVAADAAKGTFEYQGDLSVGTTVAVYEGLIPTARTEQTPVEQNGDVAYLTITERDGNCYSYTNAEVEDVIFKPELLPIPAEADVDEEANTITVDNSYFDYSADVYANIELDSLTTVDVGDFLMFYTGDFGTEEGENAAALTGEYGKVQKVETNDDGTTTVTYILTAWDEVRKSMDVYATADASGEDLLAGIDIDQMEEEIRLQAINSGFVEEAAQYLASLALATENFTKLSDNMNLQDYKVTLEDGTPISPEEFQLMSGGQFTVKVETPENYPIVEVNKNITGLKNGISIRLEMLTKVTIENPETEAQIIISVGGSFVQDAGVDFGLSGKAVWDVWAIFPYISEYRVTADVNIYNFSSADFDAVMETKKMVKEEEKENTEEKTEENTEEKTEEKTDEEKNKEVDSLVTSIKDMLNKNDANGQETTKDEELGHSLIHYYQEMLKQESQWITLVDKNVFSMSKRVPAECPIIEIETSMDFVIRMNAAASVGFDFEYKNQKKYVFVLDVFARSVNSDVINLQEETCNMSFYALGKVAVKMGLELTFEVGILDTNVASVAFTAEAGPYAELWGYFFFEYNYAESAGQSMKAGGAMLIEVGAYLDLGLSAAAGDLKTGTLSLYEKQWMLKQIGRQDNVLEFTTTQENMPSVNMKHHIRSVQIPDSIFQMTYMNMKTGNKEKKIYEDYYDSLSTSEQYRTKNFEIVMTNDKFSYDPTTNEIKVNPLERDMELKGEMIITWVRSPLAFSSRPIQRTISLHWDNTRDGYVIVPYTDGGSYVPIINEKYGAIVKVPANPVKLGYNFEGWYSDEALTTPYTFPATMPGSDADIYAKWSPATDTPYKVEHYQEQLESGEYELVEEEFLAGTTNAYVMPNVKSYTGYVAPAKQQIQIAADGSTILRYYYSLQWHTVTFAPGEIKGESESYDLKYGGRIIAPQMAEKGYTFVGWTMDGTTIVVPETRMGTQNLVYTALWTKNQGIDYRVEYYVQQTNGKYVLQDMVEKKAFTGAVLTAEAVRAYAVGNATSADAKYMIDDGIVYKNMTVKGVECNNAVVEGSGKTVIKIYYERLKHNVTFDLAYPESTPISKDIFFDGTVDVPNKVTRTGYVFAGWSKDGVTAVTPDGIMGTDDVTYYALWENNHYTVSFDKGNDLAQGNMDNMSFVYDVAQNLTGNSFTYQYYTFAGWATQKGGRVDFADMESVKNLTPEVDGQVTLYAVWTPTWYTITYNGVENAMHSNPTAYNVESPLILFTTPVRTGYIFEGWYGTADFTGEPVTQVAAGVGGDITLFAKWSPRTDIPVKVEHYKQSLTGQWVLADTDALTGTADGTILAGVKNYEGFTSPDMREVTVNADGSTVVRYEYTRNQYTLTLDVNNGSLEEGVADVITTLYEASYTLPTPTREGYGFAGWYSGENIFTMSTMPACSQTLTAKWIEGEYGYTVNHYQQNVSGEGYTLVETESATGLMDHDITPAVKTYNGFASPNELKTITIGTNEAANLVEYYYTRNQYALTWDFAGGSAQGQSYTEGLRFYGSEIIVPSPVRPGYSYTWDKTPVSIMPTEPLTYTAVWKANEYQVMFRTNGGSLVSGSVSTKTVTFDATYGELPVLSKTGYTFDGWFSDAAGGSCVTAETKVTTAGNHTLYARFTPVNYSITYHNMTGATHTNPSAYTIETGGITLTDAARSGYTFNGWYADAALTQPAKIVAAGSTGAKEFYAKWTENTYTVIFHTNNGTDSTISQVYTMTEQKALTSKPATWTKTGYTFAGWALSSSDSVAKYTDGQSVKGLSSTKDGEVHLYAVWTANVYSISYENLSGATNAKENPTSFTLDDNRIVLSDAKKTGYTFSGWYYDKDLKNKATGVIVLDKAQNQTFYAKWTPNQYVVIFDSCLGVTVPNESQLMEYNKTANLTTLSKMTNFKKPGYTFKGWATSENGAVVYKDGASVTNLVAEGGITLYAKWELNVFSITYNLGVGATENSSKNVSSYSIESGDVTLYQPTAKAGYQFLGWYDGNTLVREIVKGTQKNYSLTAKWGHGGYFTLAYKTGTSMSDGQRSTLTFEVTRTLPEGTIASKNPQHIYYRTINGTAFGTTIDYATAGDTAHFKHAAGYVVFDENCGNGSTKTFTVEDWTAYTGGNMAATFHINGTNRYYDVEIYKIVDTVGTCKGYFGDTISVRRNQEMGAAYNLATSKMYNWYEKNVYAGPCTVDDNGYGSNETRTFSPKGVNDEQLTAAEKTYRDLISDYYMMKVQMEVRELDHGYQYIAFYNNAGTKFTQYKVEIDRNKIAKEWTRTMKFPCSTSSQGDIEFEKDECILGWDMYDDTDGTKMAKISDTENITMKFEAEGAGTDDWQYRNIKVNTKVYDAKAPAQVGIAPLSFASYAAGDMIHFTVIYDEVINSASNLSFGSISLPVSNITYVDGVGTNVLHFVGTVSSAFEVSSDTNDTLRTSKCVSGTVKDILGN